MSVIKNTKSKHEEVVNEINYYLNFKTISSYKIEKIIEPCCIDTVKITIEMSWETGMKI